MECEMEKETMFIQGNALDDSRQFAGEILWMPHYMLDMLTLIIGASHVVDEWYTVPRVLFTSPEGQSGKTTGLDVVHLLGNNTWDATGATSFSIRSRFNERVRPFPVIDEISMIFGTSGLSGNSNELAKIIRTGYRRKAVISMSVDRSSVDVSIFCFMAFAGLRAAVPGDIYTRCIPFTMKPKPAGVHMPRNSVDPDTEAEAEAYRMNLHAYMAALRPYIKRAQRRFRAPHPKFTDRKDQIYRCVYLTALASDQYEDDKWKAACLYAQENSLPAPEKPHMSWAQKALTAFKAQALDASDLPSLLPHQKLLRDVAGYFRETGEEFAFADVLKDALRANADDEIWDVLTDRKIERLFGQALGESSIRMRPETGRRARGYYAAPVLKAWDRLEASLTGTVAEEEEEPSLFDDLDDDTPDTPDTPPLKEVAA